MSQNNHQDSLTTPAASPEIRDDQSFHNMDSLNFERRSNSGNNAPIGSDSRGTHSPSALFSTRSRSQSITERHEFSERTSQTDITVFNSSPRGGPSMDAPWKSASNSMNDWPNRLFTTSPPTGSGNMLPQGEYLLPVAQQNLASSQNPAQTPVQPPTFPVFQPPQGSLRLFNLRVWEDCRGNNTHYWETVYLAILELQTRFGELVILGASTGKEPRYKCGVCNHSSVRHPSRNKDTSQRRWDLSPHILTHARTPIKPWFSACGKSYGRSHDQRRHSESCLTCKSEAASHSLPQEHRRENSAPSGPAPRPFPPSPVHPNAFLMQGPFAHPTHQHIQPAMANHIPAHITGHSVDSNQYHHSNRSLPSGSGTFDNHHMTNQDHSDRTRWHESVSRHLNASHEFDALPPSLGNAVIPQPQQAPSQTPHNPIEHPSGHCFTGYSRSPEPFGPLPGQAYLDPRNIQRYREEKRDEVSKLGSMLSSCDEVSDLEALGKKARCNHEPKIAHRVDYTAIVLGLILASVVFYFGLRWYLILG